MPSRFTDWSEMPIYRHFAGIWGVCGRFTFLSKRFTLRLSARWLFLFT